MGSPTRCCGEEGLTYSVRRQVSACRIQPPHHQVHMIQKRKKKSRPARLSLIGWHMTIADGR